MLIEDNSRPTCGRELGWRTSHEVEERVHQACRIVQSDYGEIYSSRLAETLLVRLIYRDRTNDFLVQPANLMKIPNPRQPCANAATVDDKTCRFNETLPPFEESNVPKQSSQPFSLIAQWRLLPRPNMPLHPPSQANS